MKRKKTAALALAFCLLLGMLSPALAAGGMQEEEDAAAASTGVTTSGFKTPDFDVPCKAAVLFEQDTGAILYSKNADDRLYIASITKVMTLILTFEAIESGRISLTDYVPVSEHAYSMGGSQIWLEPGEKFTVDELLKAVTVASANDAAVALAEMVGGSEEAFAEMMNRKAQDLGMENTHFINACGLDIEGHYSSARDVAIMSRELLTKHPQVTKYTTIWTDTLREGETQLTNTNKLLKQYAGITGLKTGTTNGAGVCISASATRDGTSLIAVVLGSPSSAERFDAAKTLLNYGFANYEVVPFPATGAAPTELPVSKGAARKVALTFTTPEKLLTAKGEGSSLSATFDLPSSLSAPVHKGDEVGVVTVKKGDSVVGTYSVQAAEDVGKMNFKTGLSLLTNSLLTM